MAKKNNKVKEEYSPNAANAADPGSKNDISKNDIELQLPPDMPDEAKKKLLEIKEKLEHFKKKVMDKFSDYILGISLLPPPKPEVDEEGKEIPQDKNKIYILTLIDDSDSKKMSKEELKQKLVTIIGNMAEEVDKNLMVETLLLTELWQSCYDGKYDYLQTIAMSMPVFDKGLLSAIKLVEVHKTMVLKKFEKYIVSYVLAGSFVQGKPNPHDIDVYIVIDDTDVKKMTRAELKDKLRAIIVGMAIDAGDMTGVKGKLHVQVYIMTDFWDNLKEAHPVILTFLRDGVPFYDRGIFMPWKQLLQMGRVKPSQESIDMFMSTGDQILERIQFKMVEIASEDIYYATLTPMQAAIMLYGLPPPTPRETIKVAQELFVDREKLLEQEYVDILEKIIIKTRKAIEYGDKKTVTGKEIDGLVEDAKKFLKRLTELFKQIEVLKENDSIKHNYETVVTIVRDILKLEGFEKVSDNEILKHFEMEIIHKGLIPERYLRMLKDIMKAKKDYDANKLSKTEVQEVNKDARELIKFLVEYIQRKRGRELERVKIRVKHGNRYGEVILLEKEAFIIHDIDNEEKEITHTTLTPDGEFKDIRESSLEELEKALSTITMPEKTFIKEKIFEHLKGIFGKDVEILVNY